jgi:hypothetical protein
LEAWHGDAASWVLPACQPFRRLEVTAGVGSIWEEGGNHRAEYVIQGKTLFRDLEEDSFGIGLVAGAGLDPLAQLAGAPLPAAFAYVPFSVGVRDRFLTVHQNVGWRFQRADSDAPPSHVAHVLTWATRLDVRATPNLKLMGEMFGEGRMTPEYQFGLRTELVPDRLLLDVSYAVHRGQGLGGTGLIIGFAWTPAPIFRRRS